jgi:hypothetical protein
MSESPTLLELDDRKRISLGRLARHGRYLATVFDDGRIVLEPAAVISEAELRLKDDERFWSRVADAAKKPTQEVPEALL